MAENRKITRRSAVRFDTAVNGERVCLAGSGRYGVLSLALTWVRRDPRKRSRLKTPEAWCREECNLRIGALTGGYQESWEIRALKKGDEITIRILGAGSSDMPRQRTRAIRMKTSPGKAGKVFRKRPHTSPKED